MIDAFPASKEAQSRLLDDLVHDFPFGSLLEEIAGEQRSKLRPNGLKVRCSHTIAVRFCMTHLLPRWMSVCAHIKPLLQAM